MKKKKEIASAFDVSPPLWASSPKVGPAGSNMPSSASQILMPEEDF